MSLLSKKSFTLIEILVAMAVISLIAGFVFVYMNGAIDSGKDMKRKADIEAIKNALIQYRSEHYNISPVQATSCEIGNNCTVLSSALAPFLVSFPQDPNGTYYTYQSTNGNDCTISAVLSNGTTYAYTCPFSCGDTVTFTYNGGSVTYGTVTSQAGKCFMDRNLGASRVATVYDDSAAFGDYFQWGRLDDGHQVSTSGTTGTLSTTDNPGHGNFIITPDSPWDWRSPQNDNLWQGVNGINNPCPAGWRLPTSTEWSAEIAAGSWTGYNSAYASPLKLTTPGRRAINSGFIVNVGLYAWYWSSSVSGIQTSCLFSRIDSTWMSIDGRAAGFPVRCISD